MNKEAIKFLALVVMVGLLSFYQPLSFSIFGAKPNWALLAVIAASFFVKDIWEKLFFVVFSAFILKFTAGFESEILIFSLVAAGAVIAEKYLPWYSALNNSILIAAATLFFYFLVDKSLVFSRIFVNELVLNIIFGSLIFAFFYFLWQNEE